MESYIIIYTHVFRLTPMPVFSNFQKRVHTKVANHYLPRGMWHRIRIGFVCAALVAVVALVWAGPKTVRPTGLEHVHLPAGWSFIPEPGAVLALALDGGTLWVGSKQGLYEIDMSAMRCRGRVSFDPPVNHVRSLAVDETGNLWIGHLDGLVRKGKEGTRAFGKNDGLPAKRVDAIAIGTDGKPWLGTPLGLMRVENDRVVTTPETAKLPVPIIAALLVEKNGTLWTGSSSTPDGGVTVFSADRKECRVFQSGTGLPHPYVDQFMADQDGTVWAATGQFERGGGCVFAHKDTGWNIVNTLTSVSAGLPEDHVRSLLRDADGDLWIGFENQGLAVMTAGGLKRIGIKSGFPCREVTCMALQNDGAIWIGTLAGVIRVDRAAAAAFKAL